MIRSLLEFPMTAGEQAFLLTPTDRKHMRPFLRQYVFSRAHARNGIRVPLPYASSLSAAQVSRTFDTLRAIRRCGTHPVSVIDIVAIVVDVAIAVNDCCLVIVIARRAQPPTNGAAIKPIQPCPLSIIIQAFSEAVKRDY